MSDAKIAAITNVEGSKQYDIPMTQVYPKADGSGQVEVVVRVARVTKQQLVASIAQDNQRIIAQQQHVAKLQAQLYRINELEIKGA